eukprot:ANDGO_05027.mRNA.1 Glutathione gamma-glutamylcysteinyltransferase
MSTNNSNSSNGGVMSLSAYRVVSDHDHGRDHEDEGEWMGSTAADGEDGDGLQWKQSNPCSKTCLITQSKHTRFSSMDSICSSCSTTAPLPAVDELSNGVLSQSAFPPPGVSPPLPPTQSLYKRQLPANLVPFASVAGRAVFKEALQSEFMNNYFVLAENFRTQSDPAFCGLSSLVMVLNAFAIDPMRIWKHPWRWYTEEMLDCCSPLDVVRKEGVTLQQFACLGHCTGLDISTRIGNEVSIEQFERDIMTTTSNPDVMMVVSVSRKSLGQTGDGHFSPIAGYHKEKKLVLLLESASFKYPFYWVPLDLLYESLQPIDAKSKMPRGYALCSKSVDSLGGYEGVVMDHARAAEFRQSASTPNLEAAQLQHEHQLLHNQQLLGLAPASGPGPGPGPGPGLGLLMSRTASSGSATSLDMDLQKLALGNGCKSRDMTLHIYCENANSRVAKVVDFVDRGLPAQIRTVQRARANAQVQQVQLAQQLSQQIQSQSHEPAAQSVASQSSPLAMLAAVVVDYAPSDVLGLIRVEKNASRCAQFSREIKQTRLFQHMLPLVLDRINSSPSFNQVREDLAGDRSVADAELCEHWAMVLTTVVLATYLRHLECGVFAEFALDAEFGSSCRAVQIEVARLADYCRSMRVCCAKNLSVEGKR